VSEGLAHVPYTEARVGFEAATLRTQDTELTTMSYNVMNT